MFHGYLKEGTVPLPLEVIKVLTDHCKKMKARSDRDAEKEPFDAFPGRMDYDRDLKEPWIPDYLSPLYGTEFYGRCNDAQKLMLNQMGWVAHYQYSVIGELLTLHYNNACAKIFRDNGYEDITVLRRDATGSGRRCRSRRALSSMKPPRCCRIRCSRWAGQRCSRCSSRSIPAALTMLGGSLCGHARFGMHSASTTVCAGCQRSSRTTWTIPSATILIAACLTHARRLSTSGRARGDEMNLEQLDERCERLYQRALSAQWDSSSAIAWDTPLRLQEVRLRAPLGTGAMARDWPDLPPDLRADLVRSCLGTLLTNLVYGETFVDQATAELAERLPSPALRGMVATQSIDEARHASVLLRYLHEKLGLLTLPTRHVASSRLPEGTQLARESWQTTTLMVLCLEVAAMAAIQGLRTYCDEPLLHQLLRRIVSDESRHISSLTLALRNPAMSLSDAERCRLQDIAILGWLQGLAVTERPVLTVARTLADETEEIDDSEWIYFRKLIASTLIPKLELIGIYDETLAARLEGDGCPIVPRRSASTMDHDYSA